MLPHEFPMLPVGVSIPNFADSTKTSQLKFIIESGLNLAKIENEVNLRWVKKIIDKTQEWDLFIFFPSFIVQNIPFYSVETDC